MYLGDNVGIGKDYIFFVIVEGKVEFVKKCGNWMYVNVFLVVVVLVE